MQKEESQAACKCRVRNAESILDSPWYCAGGGAEAEEQEPEGGEGYGRLSADEHLQAWHYQLQIPVILSH